MSAAGQRCAELARAHGRTVEQDVFGLQVAVDDVERVQVLEREDKFRDVQPRARLRKDAVSVGSGEARG